MLNSLAGRHVELCLQALRPGGWHCEIGKVDIYADNDLSLRIFRKNLRFAAIDVDRLMVDDPLLSRELSVACLDLLDQGALPPLPVTVFPYKDYVKALRMMTTGQHQGKLVLKAPEASVDSEFPVADVRPFLDPDATYLVTGGLGGFGLRFLPYLVAVGARHLTLMDHDPGRRRDAGWIRQSSALAYMGEDVEFDIVPGDVGVEEDVQRCVAHSITSSCFPRRPRCWATPDRSTTARPTHFWTVLPRLAVGRGCPVCLTTWQPSPTPAWPHAIFRSCA